MCRWAWQLRKDPEFSFVTVPLSPGLGCHRDSATSRTARSSRKINRQAWFVVDEDFLSALAEEVSESTERMEEQQMALQACLKRLPERQRDMVRRRYSDGASIKAVAEQIGIAASAVKQTLLRARGKLIDCVRYRMKEQLT